MFTPTSQTRDRTYSDVIKKVIDADFSQDEIIIASGAGQLKLGTVLGQITATKKYVLQDPAAADGSEVARAILGEAVLATSADVPVLGVIWGAIVVLPELHFKAGITEAEKAAAVASLAEQKILARGV